MTTPSVQTIVTPNGEEFVILARAAYEALLAASEDAEDRIAIEARCDEPVLSHGDVLEILQGSTHPLAAWRKTRGMTQSALSARAGVRSATISDIESGKSSGRFDVMQRIASALDVDLTDLVSPSREVSAAIPSAAAARKSSRS